MLKTLAVLLSLSISGCGMFPCFADESECKSPVALFDMLAAQKFSFDKLEKGALAAFNARLAAVRHADPSDIPDMDMLVIVHPPMTEGDALLLAFNKGCLVAHMKMPDGSARAILDSTRS